MGWRTRLARGDRSQAMATSRSWVREIQGPSRARKLLDGGVHFDGGTSTACSRLRIPPSHARRGVRAHHLGILTALEWVIRRFSCAPELGGVDACQPRARAVHVSVNERGACATAYTIQLATYARRLTLATAAERTRHAPRE